MKLKLLILFLGFIKVSFSQGKIYKAYYNGIQNEELNYSDYQKIEKPKITDFVGEYGFGYSEAEYELEILFSNKKLYARETYHPIVNGLFENKTERVLIKYSKEEIIIDKSAYQLYKCIEPSIYNKKGEKGIGSVSIENKDGQEIHSLSFHQKKGDIDIKGMHPETSFVKLQKSELINYSKKELQIIRNEIFARNGHIFVSGGQMEKYFSNKEWYEEIKKINPNELSEIEKYNVELIQKLENNFDEIPEEIKNKLSLKSEKSDCIIKKIEKIENSTLLTVDFIKSKGYESESGDFLVIENNNPKLRTFILPNELLNKHNETLKTCNICYWQIKVSKGKIIEMNYFVPQ